MAAMAMDPSSPAPAAKLPTPSYHHSPPAAAAEEAATLPPKPAGQRSPLPSPLQLSGYSLHDLLLLSPPPSSRRNRSMQRGAGGTGVDESLEMAGTPPRRRRRGAGEQRAAPPGSSPRNARRARRRLEKEIEAEEDAARRARRRKSTRAAPKSAAAAVAADKVVVAEEEDISLALVPSRTDATHGTDVVEQTGWGGLCERIVELLMWKNVAKSALWFGLGSMFFFSCSFSREITFSPISALCHFGVMILGLAFFKDSVPQRQQVERGRSFQLTEEDVLRAARAVLPIANSLISMARVIFSGDPSMTLKVLPVLLFGAKYGSLVPVWRLLATGFFTSFTLPRLYICYSSQIHRRFEILRDWALEAWKPCPRKKLVAATAVTMCWNLFSVKTRVMAGFQPKLQDQWKAGNWSQGCVRNPPLDCQFNQTGDGFLPIPNIRWPDFSYWVSTVNDEAGCIDACQNNCSCGAYVYLTTTGCLTWGNELIDVYQFQSGGYTLNLKLPASELRSHHAIWKIVTTVSAVVLFVLIACFFLWWKRGRNIKDAVHRSWRSRRSSIRSQQSSAMLDITQSIPFNDETEDGKSHELKVYSLDRIKAATYNFSDSKKLGAGGFGPVYMGKLPGGEEFAVKRLSKNSGQGLEEFKNEVILIAKLQHRNLVRLLGCCIQGEEKILVYEYMPNKSLDAFLFNPEKQGLLDWRTRFDIIEGIARGMLYLHRDSRLRVVHRDLKASNILLDTDMNPKISDFGMARMFGGDQNQFNTNRVVGTFGYMSPEYAMEGIFSVKSDVYSFGILILEIITGKRAVSFHGQQDSLNMAGYAWRQWNEDKGEELIDPLIRSSCSLRQVLRCIHIALLCVQDHAQDRPDMPAVILMLSSDSSNLRMPRPPTLMLQDRATETSKSSEKDKSHSIGTVSMTQLHGR